MLGRWCNLKSLAHKYRTAIYCVKFLFMMANKISIQHTPRIDILDDSLKLFPQHEGEDGADLRLEACVTD